MAALMHVAVVGMSAPIDVVTRTVYAARMVGTRVERARGGAPLGEKKGRDVR